MQQLQDFFTSENPYAANYKQMHELLTEEENRARAEGREPLEVTLRFSSDGDRDERRYNKPTVQEVAAIFVGADGSPPSNKDIVIYPRDAEKQRVSELHEVIDPMSYPLLFPWGLPEGWTLELKHSEYHTAPNAQRTRSAVLGQVWWFCKEEIKGRLFQCTCSYRACFCQLRLARLSSFWLNFTPTFCKRRFQ